MIHKSSAQSTYDLRLRMRLICTGCTKIYREKVSSATAERSQLKRVIGAPDADVDRSPRPQRATS